MKISTKRRQRVAISLNFSKLTVQKIRTLRATLKKPQLNTSCALKYCFQTATQFLIATVCLKKVFFYALRKLLCTTLGCGVQMLVIYTTRVYCHTNASSTKDVKVNVSKRRRATSRCQVLLMNSLVEYLPKQKIFFAYPLFNPNNLLVMPHKKMSLMTSFMTFNRKAIVKNHNCKKMMITTIIIMLTVVVMIMMKTYSHKYYLESNVHSPLI